MPLWHRDVKVLHPRDLDSLPSKEEVLYINGFENGDYSIGTIRSHSNHHGIACRMLAGLSSFKPDKIPLNIKGFDFNYYYSQRHSKYGSDQDLMIETFTKEPSFTEDNFLDYRINKQHHAQAFPCKEFDDNLVGLGFSYEQSEVLDTIKNLHPIEWLGEPCDARGEYLNFVLKKFPLIEAAIVKSNYIKDFYNENI